MLRIRPFEYRSERLLRLLGLFRLLRLLRLLEIGLDDSSTVCLLELRESFIHDSAENKMHDQRRIHPYKVPHLGIKN
jgi:hypothetical protein